MSFDKPILQTTQEKILWDELERLKFELFGDITDSDILESLEPWRRYESLLGYFFPQERRKDWIDPMIK